MEDDSDEEGDPLVATACAERYTDHDRVKDYARLEDEHVEVSLSRGVVWTELARRSVRVAEIARRVSARLFSVRNRKGQDLEAGSQRRVVHTRWGKVIVMGRLHAEPPAQRSDALPSTEASA